MLYVISPAKTLDTVTPIPAAVRRKATEPLFLDQAAELIGLLQARSPAQLAELMDLSDDLAQLNFGRHALWSRQHTDADSRPAAFTFDGDVYDGLRAPTLGARDLTWAQQHLVILSGLYGVLRPLDRLHPYRLEMGSRLANRRGPDLYAFWGDTLAVHLNERLAAERSPVLVNLASQEYFRAVHRPTLQARVVECVFEDWKAGQYKVISFFAKRARGAMARWAIEQRIASPRGLQAFDAEGYAFDKSASKPDRLVFRRRTG